MARAIQTLVGTTLLLSLSVITTPARSTEPAQPPWTCCLLTESAQPDKRGTAQQPFVVDATSARNPSDPAREKADRLERHRNELIAEGIGFFTVLILAIQGYALFFQARLLDKSIKSSERTAQRQLRAYLFVDEPWIAGVQAGMTPQAVITFKNSGQTPAYKVRVAITSFFALGTSFKDAPALGEPTESRGSLGPGAYFTVGVPAPVGLTAKDLNDIRDGRRSLFVYGGISYFDTFDEAHWTSLRVMVGGEAGMRGKRPDGNLALASCEAGNETDDDIGHPRQPAALNRFRRLYNALCAPLRV